MWVQRTMYYSGGQDRTNPFTAVRDGKSAMRPFATLLWTLLKFQQYLANNNICRIFVTKTTEEFNSLL